MDNIGLIGWDACLELNFGLGYKGDALPDLDFIKVTPFLDLDFGDALPGPGFRLGLLKRRPPGFGFHKDRPKYKQDPYVLSLKSSAAFFLKNQKCSTNITLSTKKAYIVITDVT
ncbi:unnamed protein product [Rhizophagus irregularis]|nr:unnamed protein product [Rhizophagus irregularis]